MKKEELLAICLEAIRNGQYTIDECLTRYPDLDAELRSLLEIADKIRPAADNASLEFKQRAKRYLYEQMQEPAPVSRRWSLWPASIPARLLISVFTSLLVLGSAGGGTVYAAQSSLPGETLYPVKIGFENMQLALTTDPAEKASLHLELAQKRIDEAREQIAQNRSVNAAALETVTQQYDNAIKELSNSNNTEKTQKAISQLSIDTLNQQIDLEQVINEADQPSKQAVAQALDATRRGNTIAQVAYNNGEYLDSQPTVTDDELDLGPFSIEGTLISTADGNWNVDGTIINNVHYKGELPETGSRVSLKGVAKDDGFYVSSLHTQVSTPEPTVVEGHFGGNNQNGTANIGGVPVQIEGNGNTPLNPGDKVKLEGQNQDGRLNVTGKETPADTFNTTANGTLKAVNTADGSLSVEITGNQITVDIKDAGISGKNRGKQELTIADLAGLTGHEIELSGLTKQNGVLTASQVIVNMNK